MSHTEILCESYEVTHTKVTYNTYNTSLIFIKSIITLNLLNKY